MNITESNHTTVLLRALQGDPTIEAERVAESALFLQQRVHDALKVCPAVDQSLILSGTVILQVNLGGPNFDGALDEPEVTDPAAPVLDALDESGLVPGAKDLKLTGKVAVDA